MKPLKAALLLAAITMCAFQVQAQDTTEHPLIRPFPGSKLDAGGRYMAFDEYTFRVTDATTKKPVKKTVRGKFWRLTYRLYDAQGKWDGSHSSLEYLENYKQAALERNGTILLQDRGSLTFTLPGDDGSTTWCEVSISNKSQQDLRIIEEAGFKKSLSFGPAEMMAAIDSDGRVQLYDILFDLDKATLQPESTKQLQQVVTLLKDHPDLKVEVQGHTDDQGTDEYNLKLSQRRAEAVVSYLQLFGIETSRLVPKGYGESKPLKPNATEDDRAKNRRVELVRLASQGASAKEGASKGVAQLIVGKWGLAPNKRASKGSISFNQNGTYELHEELRDGSGVTTKGEYKLAADLRPVRIDLCVDKCGGPGSEWTTRLGIMRVLPNEQLEICTSPDGRYPSDFAKDRSAEQTMILTTMK